MSFDTFKWCVDAALELDDRIALSGGEPTTHPLFWGFVSYALQHSNKVWVCTNGKLSMDAVQLADMARCGELSAVLSQDRWHEPIDPVVVDAFDKPAWAPVTDKREIRRVDHDLNVAPQRAGRSLTGKNLCPCEGSAFVDTSGFLYPCGCDDAPMWGHVSDSQFVKTLHGVPVWACHDPARRWPETRDKIERMRYEQRECCTAV